MRSQGPGRTTASSRTQRGIFKTIFRQARPASFFRFRCHSIVKMKLQYYTVMDVVTHISKKRTRGRNEEQNKLNKVCIKRVYAGFKWVLLKGKSPHNWHEYKFTVVYCESVNLIGYIIVCYLLIVNSYASAHIARHVWTWWIIIKQFFSTCYLTFFPFYAMRLR